MPELLREVGDGARIGTRVEVREVRTKYGDRRSTETGDEVRRPVKILTRCREGRVHPIRAQRPVSRAAPTPGEDLHRYPPSTRLRSIEKKIGKAYSLESKTLSKLTPQ